MDTVAAGHGYGLKSDSGLFEHHYISTLTTQRFTRHPVGLEPFTDFIDSKYDLYVSISHDLLMCALFQLQF